MKSQFPSLMGVSALVSSLFLVASPLASAVGPALRRELAITNSTRGEESGT